MTVTFKNGDKVTGSKDMLNLLAISFSDAACWQRYNNRMSIADMYQDCARTITSALSELGFYDVE